MKNKALKLLNELNANLENFEMVVNVRGGKYTGEYKIVSKSGCKENILNYDLHNFSRVVVKWGKKINFCVLTNEIKIFFN